MTTTMTAWRAGRVGALLLLPLLLAASASPQGRWKGVTAMAHGALTLSFELTSTNGAWSGRAMLTDVDLTAHGVPMDSLHVQGDSIRFVFDVQSQMGMAHIGVSGAVDGETAAGTISLSSQGIVVDRGTWTAERTGT